MPEALSAAEQASLLDEVMGVIETAPLYVPSMPRSGKPLSVHMTNCGALGWVADRSGYRYQSTHPVTGRSWPPIPESLLALWAKHARYRAPPEACLVNVYRGDARMGLHVDADEDARDAPVLSVSLGDGAVFRIGGADRRNPTQSFKLRSGDVLVLDGESRSAFHGVDRIMPGTSRLVPGGGRINLTLRRVTTPC